MSRDKYCIALFWVKINGKLYPVIPLRSMLYLLVIACFAGVGLYSLDKYYTPKAKGYGVSISPVINSHGSLVEEDVRTWKAENELITKLLFKKLCGMWSESKERMAQPIWVSSAMPYPVSKQPGKKRIFVVGDSFVWGDGNENANDIWWRQLQQVLTARGYCDVEVVAAGLCGASTEDQLNWLRKNDLAQKMEADAVVVGYVTNDPVLRDVNGEYSIKQDFSSLPKQPLPFISKSIQSYIPYLTAEMTSRYNNKLAVTSPERGYSYQEWELLLLKGNNFAQYNRLLSELSEFIDKLGIPTFFVTLPITSNRSYYSVRYIPILKAFKEHGITMYNSFDAFEDKFSLTLGGFTVNPVNGHPSPRNRTFLCSVYCRYSGERISRGSRSQRQNIFR